MIRVRPMRSTDMDGAAEVLYDAFARTYELRGHTPPFNSNESAVWLIRAYRDLDPAGCFVAERGGHLVGTGFVHARGAVASIGPVAASPRAAPGVGRALMEEMLASCAQASTVRLFQDAFNPDSYGLYVRLGFRVVDVAPYLLTRSLVPPVSAPRTVSPWPSEGLGAIIRYDHERTGSDRRADLTLLAETASVLVHGRSDAMRGYVFVRSLPQRLIVGPALADDDTTLADLVDAVAAAHPDRTAVMRPSGRAPATMARAFLAGFRADHLSNLMIADNPRAAPVAPAVHPHQLFPLFPESL